MTISPETQVNGDPAAAQPDQPDQPDQPNAAEDVEVVSNRYFASGEWELHSADGVKFRIGRQHLHGS